MVSLTNAFWVSSLILFLFALWASWFVDRRRNIFKLTLLVLAVQSMVSGILYLMSMNRFLNHVEAVTAPGVWAVFGDAAMYQSQAEDFVLALSQKRAPNVVSVPVFTITLAWFYQIAGLSSLSGILLNSWMHAMLLPVIWLAFRGQCPSGREALAMAGVVSVPSTYLYASQILREPIIWITLLPALGICCSSFSRPQKIKNYMLKVILLWLLVTCLYEIRPYLTILIIISLLLTMFICCRSGWTDTVFRFGLIATTLLGIVSGGENLAEKALLRASPFKKYTEYKQTSENYKPGKSGWSVWLNQRRDKSTALTATKTRLTKTTNNKNQSNIENKNSESKNIFRPLGWLMFDLSCLSLSCYFIKKKIKKFQPDLHLSKNKPALVFLGSFCVLLFLVVVFFGNSLGNNLRYLTPILCIAPLLLALREQKEIIED